MKRRVVVAGLSIVVLALAGGLYASNALRSTAEARFSRGERGLNDLTVRGPSGLHCIVYDVVPGLDGRPTLGGYGAGPLPLFGSSVQSANYYPEAGETLGVVPEQHVRLTGRHSPAAAIEVPRAGTEEKYGMFLLVTRDPTWARRLETDAPPLTAAAAPPSVAPAPR